MLGSHGDIHVQGLTDGLAVVERFHHRKMFTVFVNDVGDFVQDFGTFIDRDVLPGFKSSPGSRDGVLNIFSGRLCTFVQDFTICGAVAFIRGLVGGFLPFTIDKELVGGFKMRLFHDFPL